MTSDTFQGVKKVLCSGIVVSKLAKLNQRLQWDAFTITMKLMEHST